MPEMARSHVQWALGRWGDPNAFDDPGFRQHCSEVCAERAPVGMHRICPLMAPFTFLNWSITEDGLEALRMRNAKGMESNLCFRFGREPTTRLPRSSYARSCRPLLRSGLPRLPTSRPLTPFNASVRLRWRMVVRFCSNLAAAFIIARLWPAASRPPWQPSMARPQASTLFDVLYDDYRYTCSLVHRDNDRARQLTPVEMWSENVERLSIHCEGAEPSAAPLGRAATASDLSNFVRLFNAYHGRAAMFDRYLAA